MSNETNQPEKTEQTSGWPRSETNGVTAQRAREFGIEGRREGESFTSFCYRVGGALREMGHLIEAHEARTNKLYDDPTNEDGMTGLIGAAAQALDNRDYHVNGGDRQLDTDFAAGTVARNSKKNDDSYLALLMLMLGR